MLDYVSDTVKVRVDVIITFKDVPEVWAALAEYPATQEEDDEQLCEVVLELEVTISKDVTAPQLAQEMWPLIRDYRDSIPIASALTENIQSVIYY
jgi:hypothetical protein